MRLIYVSITALLLAACSDGETPAQSGHFKPAMDMLQTMNLVMDPAADAIWLNSGWVWDAEGEHELFPTTDEGWDAMVAGAAMIAETGNILMVPNRPGLPEDMGEDWYVYSQGIVDVGKQLMTAAENRDKQAVFDLGGQLYNVCRACHQRYSLPQYDEEQ